MPSTVNATNVFSSKTCATQPSVIVVFRLKTLAIRISARPAEFLQFVANPSQSFLLNGPMDFFSGSSTRRSSGARFAPSQYRAR